MRVFLFFVIVSLSFWLWAEPALAIQENRNALGMQSGQDAMTICSKSVKPTALEMNEAYACLSWVNGAVQGVIATRSLNANKPEYCTPEYGGSTGQYVDIFLKFLKDYPEKRHRPAIMLFHQAMAMAFPCPKESS